MSNDENTVEIAASGWINTSVLKWARLRLGLSISNVEKNSETLGKFYTPIKAEQLSQWEQGTSEPSLEYLETLAEVYVCPVGYFFLSELPQESIPVSFRGLSAEKEGKLHPLSYQTLHRFFELADWTVSIIEQLSLNWEVKIHHPSDQEMNFDVDTLVNREKEKMGFNSDVRKRWFDADDAFLWWRKKIEEQGIFCFQMKLESGDLRGASTWLINRFPFILVNHQDVETATGRMFTLLHEYAHLITATEGIVCDFRGVQKGQSPEPFANRFAAHMLLSYVDFQERLKEIGENHYKNMWSDNMLDNIRTPFYVSRDVIAIMLQEMNLAPSDHYQKKREQWDKRKPWGRGGGGKRPTGKEIKLREIGYSLARVLSSSAKEGSIPIDDISYVLDTKVEKIPEFLTWARSEI